MVTAIVTSKGQITIPKSVRDAVGLNTGARLSFRVRDDGVIEVAPVRTGAAAVRGLLAADVAASLDEMERAIVAGALASGRPR